jgi:hypothetical protein
MKITLQVSDVVDLDAIRKEFSGYYSRLIELKDLPPREILESLSAFTARAFQVRSEIIRLNERDWTNFRTKELDPFVEECDRQFKIWSRIISQDKLDWDMTRGF